MAGELTNHIPCNDYRLAKAKEEATKTVSERQKAGAPLTEEDVNTVVGVRIAADPVRLMNQRIGHAFGVSNGDSPFWDFIANVRGIANEDKAKFCSALDTQLRINTEQVLKSRPGDPLGAARVQVDLAVVESDAVLAAMKKDGRWTRMQPEAREALTSLNRSLKEVQTAIAPPKK